jgi:diguanylate cyclase
MYFPKISEIATKDVVTVDSKLSIKDTIKILEQSKHRSVIVIDDNKYRLFSANDLIKIKLNENNLDIKIEDIPLKSIPQIHKDYSVLDSMDLIHLGIEYICVLNDDKTLYGLVTSSDIISSIDPETLMENFKIKDYFKEIIDINFMEKDRTIKEAMEIMDSSNSDCIVVTLNKKTIGILTIKDTVTILSNNIDINSKIENYYSYPLKTISENFTIKEALSYINEKHFKRLISSNDKGEITGIISQQELISYSYNHWASMMKNYHNELLYLNDQLNEKNEKLQIMATTDMLTKLYNRHMFTELFNKFLSKIKRDKGDSLVLAIIDIDNFKSINDTYGHNIGDEVLVSISNQLSSTLRSSDLCARWGGEEFVILLNNTDIEQGFNTIDKLRELISISNHAIVSKVTISIGITKILNSDTLKDSVKRADDALYQSKQKGKNKVTVG